MTCASFGSTSEVGLFYAIDPDPKADMPAGTVWKPVPYTSESLDASLSSSVSEQITPSRSYANSKLTQGEIGGSISFEAFFGSFLDNMLISALQADEDLHLVEGTRTWDDGGVIQNASEKKCYCFMKRVMLSNGNADIYLFRGMQVSSMSLSMDPGSLVTGEITLMGTGIGNPDPTGTTVYKNVDLLALPTEMATYTFESYPDSSLIAASDGLKDLVILDSTATDTGIVAQSFSFNVDNQLRQQYAVGKNTIYASGVGSGRIMVTMSLSAYYSNPVIFESFVADDEMTITFGLKDVNDKGYDFETFKVKVTSGSTPQAGSADSDLLISTELQAFEDATSGSMQVTMANA